MVASKLPLILALVEKGKTTREICDLVGLTRKREVDKTVLLCNRCHGELHNSIWSLDEKMILEQINIRKGGAF